MRYLLDSNTCIRFLNGRSLAIASRPKSTPPEQVVVCSIVKAELFYGSERSHDPARSRAAQNEFFSLFQSFPFDDSAADHAGRIRAELAVLGRPIGPHDVMIAAIALTHNLTLVTHNADEFRRVRDLAIEDWEAS